jgi:ElaB/YqjD/DUF883 family membrane-anchored ribosome-binding protein
MRRIAALNRAAASVYNGGLALEVPMENVSTEKLMTDLRAVVRDAEELLQATAGQAGARVEELRARAQESIDAARARLDEAGASAREAARDIDAQVRANPWAAVGIAAAAGLVLGLLLSRK